MERNKRFLQHNPERRYEMTANELDYGPESEGTEYEVVTEDEYARRIAEQEGGTK